MPFLTTPKKVT